MTTPPAPPAAASSDDWLASALGHLERGRWAPLVRHCALPELPAERAAPAALLTMTAVAYLGQRDRLPGAADTAVSAGVDRRSLTAGLMAAAHFHLRTAIGLQEAPDGLDAAFHERCEKRALARVRRAARSLGASGPRTQADAAQTKELRAMVDGLRRQVHALRAAATQESRVRVLLNSVRESRLTYLSLKKLESLARTCQAIEEQHIGGRFIEAGCALGGSTIVIGTLKQAERPFDVHDVFGMIPPPGEDDPPEVHRRYQQIADGKALGLGGDRYYGYELDLLQIVRRNLEQHGLDLALRRIALVQGLVQDKLVGTDPVAFAHLDVDWYEPSRHCLEQIYPRLTVGGSIIVDDYHDWGGCRRAVDEFLAVHAGSLVADDSAGSMKLTRVSAA